MSPAESTGSQAPGTRIAAGRRRPLAAQAPGKQHVLWVTVVWGWGSGGSDLGTY